jgi:hypothetical protein
MMKAKRCTYDSGAPHKAKPHVFLNPKARWVCLPSYHVVIRFSRATVDLVEMPSCPTQTMVLPHYMSL